jgi:hypothetical protein
MSNPAKDPLRELFKRELDAFAVESTRTEGIISSGRIETLTGLAKLIETRDSLQPKPRNWWAALVLLVTLVVASVLLFARVGETEIELDVSLAHLSFALAKALVLSGPVNLSALGISGLRDVQFPQSQGPPRSARADTDYAAPAVSLTPSSAGERRGSLTLSPLVLPAGARLKLGRSDVANQYQLSTNATNLIFQAAAYGPVRISLPGSPARAIDFATPKPVLMRGGSEEVSLDLTFPTLPQSPLSPQLEVRDIAFSRVDQFLEANQTLVKRLSTILSGTLSFESLNGQELRLRPGEELQVEHSQGEIRSLELAANHIDFKFHGRVSGMAAGTGEGHRSIMPTYLEWLKARHGLSLLWATSLYIFGLVAAALRWFGVRL